MGRKAIGPEMDCKATEVVEVKAYTIFGMGFFCECNNKWKKENSIDFQLI